jgi:endonuclease III
MRRKIISKQALYQAVIHYFETAMPVAETELVYKSPYELLVAVILSAQCTDKRVNIITPPFFEVFPDAETLSVASVEQVFALIKSCSYPNNKAKNLVGMAHMLVNDFHGIVPSDIDEMQKLPGVGRKTANVIASVVFNLPAMAVDTHVFRVANRIGLTTNSRTPLASERELVKNIPRGKLAIAHHWLILHGRYTCIARKPKCSECGLSEFCKYYQMKDSKSGKE